MGTVAGNLGTWGFVRAVVGLWLLATAGVGARTRFDASCARHSFYVAHWPQFTADCTGCTSAVMYSSMQRLSMSRAYWKVKLWALEPLTPVITWTSPSTLRALRDEACASDESIRAQWSSKA